MGGRSRLCVMYIYHNSKDVVTTTISDVCLWLCTFLYMTFLAWDSLIARLWIGSVGMDIGIKVVLGYSVMWV